MLKRSPSLAERLRDAWRRTSADPAGFVPGDTASDARAGRGSEFADRLRAAVAARH